MVDNEAAEYAQACDALRYFAAGPERQLELAFAAIARFAIPDFHPLVDAHSPVSDYLAGMACIFIEYSHSFYDVAEIDENHPVRDFRHRIDCLCHAAFESAWTPDAVRSGEQWTFLRQDAAKALRGLGETIDGDLAPVDIGNLVAVDEYTTSRETRDLMKQLGLI